MRYANSNPVKILSVGTAVPENEILQSEIKELAYRLFGESFQDIDRLLPVFENTQIHKRNLAKPLEWYSKPHSFTDSNKAYYDSALDLSEKACKKAIELAGIDPKEIEMIIFVSTTGIATPSIDSELIQRLNLSSSTARLPIWGLGCAGGVSGLSTAAKLKKATSKKILFVSAEICSLTFIKNDLSKSNLIATSLFGDGAAAVVIGENGNGPEILDTHSLLFDNSSDVMGWDIISDGLKVRFSKDVPSIVRNSIPDVLSKACEKWNIQQKEIKQFVFHPGGAKVLKAYKESLCLDDKSLKHAESMLNENGNLSSASVLFVLEKHLCIEKPTNTLGLMTALGPGFSAELLLFKW